MALFVSSFPDVIDAAGQTILTDEIKSSLKEMSSEELKAFSDNVSRIIDIVNEAAQQAIVFRTTGYYTAEEKQTAVDLSKKTGETLADAIKESRKINSNLAEAARKKEEDQAEAKRIEAENEIKFQRNLAAADTLNQKQLLVKNQISILETAKRQEEDYLKNFINKLYKKVKSEIDELKKSRHSFAIERMNRQLSSLTIDKSVILSAIDDLMKLITDRIKILEDIVIIIDQLKTDYSRYFVIVDKAIKEYTDLIKKRFKIGIDSERIDTIYNEFERQRQSLDKEVVTLADSMESLFQTLNDTVKNIKSVKEFTELAGELDSPKPVKDKINDVKGFVKFLEGSNDAINEDIEKQIQLTKGLKIGDIPFAIGNRSDEEGKITSSGVLIPPSVPQFAAEGSPLEAQPQFAAEGSVQGEAQPQFAAEGSVQGEPLAVQAPQGEAPAVGPVQGEELPEQEPSIYQEAINLISRPTPPTLEQKRQYINDLTREINVFEELKNVVDDDAKARIDSMIGNLKHRKTLIQKRVGGSHSSYRRRNRKGKRRTFRRK